MTSTLEFAQWAISLARNNRQKQLDEMSYADYLKTPEWKAISKRARKAANYSDPISFVRGHKYKFKV